VNGSSIKKYNVKPPKGKILAAFSRTAQLAREVQAQAPSQERAARTETDTLIQDLRHRRGGQSHNRMKLRVGDGDSTILPLLELDWQLQIDQLCLEERQREHVARMHMERIIKRIAAALLELKMRAVAPAAKVRAKIDLFDQAIRLRGRARYAVVVYFPPAAIHFLVELARFKLDCFEPLLDLTDCVILPVQAL
jgi:hypothetical protein